jgi:hypothetical protein
MGAEEFRAPDTAHVEDAMEWEKACGKRNA